MYEAFAYSDRYEREDQFFGEFHTEFDAKIACERHAGTPLQWKNSASHNRGSSAKFGHRLYIARLVTESEAAE